MKFQCYKPRPLVSCYGRFHYERALYYCRVCHESRVPLDEQLGVGARTSTPRLQRVMAYLAGHLSFGVVSQAVHECFELDLNRETIRQVAEAVGGQARQWEEGERAHYEQVGPTLQRAAPRRGSLNATANKWAFRMGALWR